jgi:hypothetical protein
MSWCKVYQSQAWSLIRHTLQLLCFLGTGLYCSLDWWSLGLLSNFQLAHVAWASAHCISNLTQ